ncbi:MAG: DUF362 domain-containing protein [Spirochaetales bacterium]|nr:DUF362 domain-containing protein [Spirochaetales bacterium]
MSYITAIYGKDPYTMTTKLLESNESLANLPKESSIVLKPNLVVAACPSEGATTHREIVEALLVFFTSRGYKNLTIAESSWIGDSTERAFKVHNYHQFEEEYGVRLVDVKQEEYLTFEVEGYPIEYSKTAYEADYLINLPVLKGHCQTKITCALKNLKGIISDRSKRLFHTWGLHEPIAALNTIRKPNLIIVDSLNGDLDFEEGGTPVETNRMFMGNDPLLIDTLAAELLGYPFEEVPYLGLAHKLKVGSKDLSQAIYTELNQPQEATTYKVSRRANRLAKYTEAKEACSACYGNLLHALGRLEEQGELNNLKEEIKIGQGFKEYSGEGIGVGICTRGVTHSLKGCPPKALEMVKFLKDQLRPSP